MAASDVFSFYEKEFFKGIVTQACLMICIENRVHKLLNDSCSFCQNMTNTYNLLDHECINPDRYKIFVHGVCNDEPLFMRGSHFASSG